MQAATVYADHFVPYLMLPIFLQADLNAVHWQQLLLLLLIILSWVLCGYFYLLKKREKETCDQLLEKKELEKKIGIMQAKQEERARISADLHDDLGSGLTSIRLYSELAIERPVSGQMPEVRRIAILSNELINNMNTIIWTMDVANDSLPNLVSYLRKISTDFFEATRIEFEINTATEIPELEVRGEARRNIYLVVKEFLSNILKHSSATNVQMNIVYTTALLITIKDNGSGMANNRPSHSGNGIRNIQKRMEMLNGKLLIDDSGSGTLVSIEIPLG